MHRRIFFIPIIVLLVLAGAYLALVRPFRKSGYYRSLVRNRYVIRKVNGDTIDVFVFMRANTLRKSKMTLNPIEPHAEESRYLGWLPGSAVYVAVTSSTIIFFSDPNFSDKTVEYEKIYNPFRVFFLATR